MTPERWHKVKEVFESALEHAPDERLGFLEQACDGDEALRREVESLLASFNEGESFMERPAVAQAAEALAGSQSESLIGQTIGHYQVTREIGRGGMGEVYLAQDVKLKRPVALKLLPSYLSKDEDRLRRFEREARAASALNHPHVCVIHEVGEMEDDRHYIVMEYVDGMTLRQRLSELRLTINEVLGIGTQIASALSAAHEAGVVHRDIKPENVMLRRDGSVKVLDFGLAKLAERPEGVAPADPTKPQVKTSTGVVMGTVSYMSPEQARGLAVDARTDIWSTGCVLYEMVAGCAPFEGETASHVIVSILEHEPVPLARRSPAVPRELERIVMKALRKDCEERYQVIKDLGLDLKSLREELEFERKLGHHIQPEAGREAAVATRTSVNEKMRPTLSTRHFVSAIKRHRTSAALALVIVTIAAAVIAFAVSKLASEQPSRDKVAGPAPRVVPLTSFAGIETASALSPDGERVAYARRTEESDNFDIYVQQVGTGSPLRLTTDPAQETAPEWSPDGRYIAFVRAPLNLTFSFEAKYGVYVIPSLGGVEHRVGEFAGGNWPLICWFTDGTSLAVRDSNSPDEPLAIYLLSIESGEKRKITSPPTGAGDFCPAFSRDGSMLAFTRGIGGSKMDVYVQPMTAGGEARRLTFDNTQLWDLTWTGDSREIVFSSDRGGSRGGLWRVPAAGGTPQSVAVAGMNSLLPHISRKGDRLAFDHQLYDTNVWRYEVPDAKGQAGPPTKLIYSSLQQDEAGHYSPDGRKIAFVSNRSGSWEIWVCEADGSRPRQLTSLMGTNTGVPRWSPDGRQVVFESRLEGHSDLFVVGEEDGRVRRLTAGASNDGAPSWSRDGRTIYFGSNRNVSNQIWKMTAEGGEAVQVTKGGGSAPLESPDGKHLYYRNGGIWRVPVEGGEEVPVIEDPRPFSWGYWAVAEKGIYFATGGAGPHPRIHFFNFATGQATEVLKLTTFRLPGDPPGLSVSLDGRWLLITQMDSTSCDIMLVENFQ